MKKLIYKTLTEDAGLITRIPANRWFQRYGLGERAIPDNPKLPFALISELPGFVPGNVHETSRALTHYFQVYIYDNVGSYTKIEEILDLVVEAVLGMEGQKSMTGSTCLESRWQTRSQDYDDNNYDAFVKHDTFKVTGSTKR